MSRRFSTRVWFAVEIVIVLAATAHAARALARAPSWTVDDAWIVARYADNLAQHGRLAWNVDGAAVEGFTSLSSALVAAFASLLHVAPIDALRALGILGLLTTGGLVLVLGHALRAPPPAAGLVAVLHLTMAEHVTHATSGLETEVFLALGLVLLIALARALRGPSASVMPLAIAAFVLTITRPEGAAAAVAALGAVVFVRRGDREARTLAARGAALGFGAPMVLVLGWRLVTYGALVPNTFFAKRLDWNAAHLQDLGTLANRHFVDLALASAACAVVVALLRWRGRVLRLRLLRSNERLVCLVSLLTLAAVTLVYARSEPVMDYAHRFAVHDLPWIDALALVASLAAVRAVRRAPRGAAVALGALLCLATLSGALRGASELPNEMTRMAVYDVSVAGMYRPMVEWILAHTQPDATIAVYPDAGIIPYETKRRAIDFGRLNDAHLARGARAPADVAEYFFARDPDVLVVSQRSPGHLWDEGAEAIVADPRFKERYTLELSREAPKEGIALMIYARSSR